MHFDDEKGRFRGLQPCTMGPMREPKWDEPWNETHPTTLCLQGLRPRWGDRRESADALKIRPRRADEKGRRCPMTEERRIGGIERRKGAERRTTARLIAELESDWYFSHGQGD